jgi:hypothetical protein
MFEYEGVKYFDIALMPKELPYLIYSYICHVQSEVANGTISKYRGPLEISFLKHGANHPKGKLHGQFAGSAEFLTVAPPHVISDMKDYLR